MTRRRADAEARRAYLRLRPLPGRGGPALADAADGEVIVEAGPLLAALRRAYLRGLADGRLEKESRRR